MFNRFNKMVNRMIKNFNYYNYKRSFDESLDIKREDIENYIKMGATIVDVRSPQEYREGHIDGAICIPDYQIKKEISKKKNGNNTKVTPHFEKISFNLGKNTCGD